MDSYVRGVTPFWSFVMTPTRHFYLVDGEVISAIAYEDGGTLVAQCIEYDVVTQATTLEMLFDRMQCLLEAELRYAKEV